ncbi:hypothetical protein CsatB_026830 [Cannabis sativa]
MQTGLVESNMEKDAKQFQMKQSNVGEVKTNVMTSIECVDGKPVNSSESEVKFVSNLKRSGNVIEGESSSGKRCRTVPSRIPSFTQFGRTLKDLGHIKGIDGVEIRGSQKSLSACKLSVRQSSCVKVLNHSFLIYLE